MSGFSPVLTGATPELRHEIESVFTTSEDAISERLTDLDTEARLLGNLVTFGAEVEATFVPNPAHPNAPDPDDLYEHLDRMYIDVVHELNGPGALPKSWRKGSVIDPRYDSDTVMLNQFRYGTYNSEQPEIMEIRTGPAHAVEANERYWKTIQAIGNVAERYGYMAIILATHINAAVLRDDSEFGRFIDFTDDFEGGKMLAGVQHNLNSMNTLQTHAGLQSGMAVLEAYPRSKHASTAVQGYRLEVRHPSIGVVDPRIDMLAALDGVNRAASRNLTATEMEALHLCSPITVTLESNDSLGALALSLIEYRTSETLWDYQSRKFVLPAQFQHNAGNIGAVILTHRALAESDNESLIDNNASTLRQALGGLSLDHGRLKLRGRESSRIIRKLIQDVSSVESTEIAYGDDMYRVVPEIFHDSPEEHAVRRTNVARSPAVRRIMGASIATLTPARDALKWRREIIENVMIEEGLAAA